MFCTRCGQQNPDDARFCARCGTGLVHPEDRSASDQTSTMSLGAIAEHGNPPAEAETAVELRADVATAVDGLAPGMALLVVSHGPNAGSRFTLDAAVTTAGRHPDSDIFLDDVTVSRRHAEFRRRDGGGFQVRDVGSLNGSYLNRHRIEEAELSNGDEVQIGRFRLVYLAPTGGAA